MNYPIEKNLNETALFRDVCVKLRLKNKLNFNYKVFINYHWVFNTLNLKSFDLKIRKNIYQRMLVKYNTIKSTNK